MAKNEPTSAGAGGERIRVEILRAWPRRFESLTLDLPAGATVAEALKLAGLSADSGEPADAPGDTEVAIAVFGERVDPGYVLVSGDRIELLRPLLADPKESRRRRAKRP